MAQSSRIGKRIKIEGSVFFHGDPGFIIVILKVFTPSFLLSAVSASTAYHSPVTGMET